MNINQAIFPEVKEGERVLWSDGKWYVYTNGSWILETN